MRKTMMDEGCPREGGPSEKAPLTGKLSPRFAWR